MKVISGRPIGWVSNRFDGPWPCEKCGQLSQFAECKSDINRIFCQNGLCNFTRIVDKRNRTIVESDGSVYRYDPVTGKKWRVNRR